MSVHAKDLTYHWDEMFLDSLQMIEGHATISEGGCDGKAHIYFVLRLLLLGGDHGRMYSKITPLYFGDIHDGCFLVCLRDIEMVPKGVMEFGGFLT